MAREPRPGEEVLVPAAVGTLRAHEMRDAAFHLGADRLFAGQQLAGDLEIGAPVIGGLSVGESSALMYDAGLRLHLPLGGLIGGLSPFVQAGAGAMRQEVRVAPAATHSTDFAYNVGGGVDLGLAPGVGLQLMVKDYIGKFDAREATSLDLDGRTAHNWTVSAGVRLGL